MNHSFLIHGKPALRVACALGLLVVSAQIGAKPTLTQGARSTEYSLDFRFGPSRIASRCEPGETFAIESVNYYRARWICGAADVAGGRLEPVDWGWLKGVWQQTVRGPVPGDGEILFLRDTAVWALDPISLDERQVTPSLSLQNATINWVQMFHLDGDPLPELLVDEVGVRTIRSLPDGALLSELPWQPWSRGTLTTGQFDDDPAGELVLQTSDGVAISDAMTLERERLLGNEALGNFTVLDWDRDGIDEGIGRPSFPRHTFRLVDPDGAVESRAVGEQSFGEADRALLVDWHGTGVPSIAAFWNYRAGVIDPFTATMIFDAGVAEQARFNGVTAMSAVDLDDDDAEDVLWVQNRRLRWLRNPGEIRELQSALDDYVLGQGVGAEGTIVTLDRFWSSQRVSVRHSETLDIVRELPSSRIWEGAAMDNLHAQVGDEVALIRQDRVQVVSSSDGASLWMRESGQPVLVRWYGLATPRGRCAGEGCFRLAYASAASGFNMGGSRIHVLDSRDGSVLFESDGDNCVGCGYTAVVLADLNGDDVADLLTSKREVGLGATVVTMRDGVTFETVWTSQLDVSAPVRAMDISHVRPQRIGALLSKSNARLLLLDVADGSILDTADLEFQSYSASMGYVPHDGRAGSWVFTDRETDRLFWTDSALEGPILDAADPNGMGGLTSLGAGAFVFDGDGQLSLKILPIHALFDDGFEAD